MNPKIYKQKLLDELYKPYLDCHMCPLGYLGRKNVVFGEGNPDADLMFIGEAPGKDEDEQGRPFVGRSGQLLNRALEKLGINREDVFITNIVKCRPPNNRQPFPNEIGICKKLFLYNQIKIIRPKVICTLGSTALNSLMDKAFPITKVHGKILSFNDITLIPTYHPAYILRNGVQVETWLEDLKLIVETIKNITSQ